MSTTLRFHCYRMVWIKNGKLTTTMVAGAGTKKDIYQCATNLGAKIIELIRITDKAKVKRLEKKYIASHS